MPKPTNKKSFYSGLSVRYPVKGSISERVESLSELFTEWFLYDSTTANSLESFIKDNGLSCFFSTTDFTDLICGYAYLDDPLVTLIPLMLPFEITPEKMQRMNAEAQNAGGRIVESAPEIIYEIIQEILQEHKSARQERKKAKDRRYYKRNRDEILARQQNYYEQNRETVLAYRHKYYEQNRAAIATQRREWYARNREALRAQRIEYYRQNREAIVAQHRKYFLRYRDAILARNREYYRQNRAAILAQQREYYERNKDAISEKRRKRYQKNREKILAQQREYREQNPEIIAERKKKHYKKHRDTVLAYQHEHYTQNREEISARHHEYYKQHREKISAQHAKYREEHSETLSEYYRQYKQQHREKIKEQQRARIQAKKQRDKSAKSVCPTFLYLLQMRHDHHADFVKLLGQRDLVGFAIKKCPALQEMDPTKCAFCTNAHDAATNCAMYNMVKLPDDAPSAIMEKVKLIKRKKRVRQYASEHAEQIAAYQQQYRQEHHDEVLAYEAEYREKNAEAVSARKKKCYQAKKAEYQAKNKAYYEQHREEIAAQQRAKREKEKVRDESAKSVCPTFLYLLQMRHDHRADFVKLLGQRDLVGFAIKKCPALQEMDASKCAFCDGTENPHTVCEMQKMATMPDGIIETMPDFVAIIKAKQTTR